MPHAVTVRTHTITTSSTAFAINIGYLKTWTGALKLLELLLGIVCVGIVADQSKDYGFHDSTAQLFFLLIVTTFMISTFILLLSFLISVSSSSIIPKTLYEYLYHIIAAALLLIASLTLIVHANHWKGTKVYELLLGASICGLVNAALYVVSSIFAFRSYRGL